MSHWRQIRSLDCLVDLLILMVKELSDALQQLVGVVGIGVFKTTVESVRVHTKLTVGWYVVLLPQCLTCDTQVV